ncbi:phosphoribosylformylglycinamidine synthase subunit PurS [Mycetocola lacteus]|uniref:Phosphoribosylformylglycinamidine synthase subunit PurS n=1 Tax=Mycetocola lacteus TaxID=76637 RepID=A0A3L7AVP6_9MICO|nr:MULTISPECIES: phosphoribosylformylglycinamidine synthase subunit PurS [Mycetocola]RLP84244.1 phosphoribosylformylglycinamidine synthase subunit PurS [Mycetocola lacteus]
MPKIIVEVMPKADLLDPQGKAVAGALGRLGHSAITDVRIGKRFELTVEGEVTEQILADVATLADEIFSNQVIEDVTSIRVEEAQA